jgi:hypothetical protein
MLKTARNGGVSVGVVKLCTVMYMYIKVPDSVVSRAAPRFRKWGDKIISRAKKFFDFVPPPHFLQSGGGQKYNYSTT